MFVLVLVLGGVLWLPVDSSQGDVALMHGQGTYRLERYLTLSSHVNEMVSTLQDVTGVV